MLKKNWCFLVGWRGHLHSPVQPRDGGQYLVSRNAGYIQNYRSIKKYTAAPLQFCKYLQWVWLRSDVEMVMPIIQRGTLVDLSISGHQRCIQSTDNAQPYGDRGKCKSTSSWTCQLIVWGLDSELIQRHGRFRLSGEDFIRFSVG